MSFEARRARRSDGGVGLSVRSGGFYCGPGWGYTYADLRDGRTATLEVPSDLIDRACAIHDECYASNGYFYAACDVDLRERLVQVRLDPRASPEQKFDASVMLAWFLVQVGSVGVARTLLVDGPSTAAERMGLRMRALIEGMLAAGATLQSTVERGIAEWMANPGR